MNRLDFFPSSIYVKQLPNLLPNIIKRTDLVIQDLKDNYVGDNHGHVYHSNSISHFEEILPLCSIVTSEAINILDQQGYDLEKHNLYITEMWVQEFAKGGYHDSHVHSGNHISGFYFISCSENTSFPVFYDPRPGKVMTQLPFKDENVVTLASEKVNFKPSPGTLVLFNSYFPHHFTGQNSTDSFRFIHFNIKAQKNH